MAEPGEGPGGPGSPLFLDQTETRRAEKKFFWDAPTPAYLRVWMTGPPFIWRSGSATEHKPESLKLQIRKESPEQKKYCLSLSIFIHANLLFYVWHQIAAWFTIDFRSAGSFSAANVSVKSKLQHPPRATPRAFYFFENYCSNSPLPGPKCRSNAPH